MSSLSWQHQCLKQTSTLMLSPCQVKIVESPYSDVLEIFITQWSLKNQFSVVPRTSSNRIHCPGIIKRLFSLLPLLSELAFGDPAVPGS